MTKIINCCIFLFALCYYGCISNGDYPKVIIDLDKKEQYDVAKFEFYKINSFYESSCKAIVGYRVGNRTECDTFDVLSLDIRLDTIEIEKDTVYYLFSFFDKSRGIDAFVLPSIDYQCNFVYAVGFINDTRIPYKYLFAEMGYAYNGKDINPKGANRMFKKHFNSKDIKINKWLINFMEENPDLLNEE